MADYHPLDTRYKGESTAYRGSKKMRAFERPDFGDDATVPPPVPQTAKPGPWGKASTPPPIPAPAPAATPQPRRKRKSPARRVFMWISLIILVVLANQYFSRTTGMMTVPINDFINDAETGGQSRTL